MKANLPKSKWQTAKLEIYAYGPREWNRAMKQLQDKYDRLTKKACKKKPKSRIRKGRKANT